MTGKLRTLFAVGLCCVWACSNPTTKPGGGDTCDNPGSTFVGDDGCSKCFCGDDGVACSSASCSADAGQPDAGVSCDDGGVARPAGQTFIGADGCSSCFCGDDGVVVCSAASCNDQQCPPCEAPPNDNCIGSGPCGCGPFTCPEVDAGVTTCGTTTCASDELCMKLPGCPLGMDIEPVCVKIPATCDAELSCGCFAEDPCGGGCTTCGGIADGQIQCDCMCRCAAPDTMIATPTGERAISELRVGDLVYSVDDDVVVVVPVVAINQQAVANHRVMSVRLTDGTAMQISPGHPTADGRTFADLEAGGALDGHSIASAALVDYEHPHTYDILPGSRSGTYFASGVLIGSTLALQLPQTGDLACK